MPIPECLSCLVLNQVNLTPVLIVLRTAGAHATDHSRGVLDALGRSNRKAWKALEVALAGDSLWSRLDRAETKAVRADIRAFLDRAMLTELDGRDDLRKKCVRELRDATAKGLIHGSLVPGDLAEKAGAFARYSDPTDLLKAERAALVRLGKEVQDAGFRTLGWVLGQPAHAGQSVVAVAARYFFRREVETSPELARGIQYAQAEALAESQADGFRRLEQCFTMHAHHIDDALAAITAEILAAVGAVQEGVAAVHEAVGAAHSELKQQLDSLLAKLEMANRPVGPEHSLAARTYREKELVRDLLGRIRAAPAGVRGGYAGDAGKLQIAVGDFAGAAQSFTAAAAHAGSNPARAEAYHNSYRARLEQRDYPAAGADLARAAALDPARFAPFPTDKYEVVRILGAGGFGVTFECRHHLTGAAVAVKSLAAVNLDHDAGAVLREAMALDRLKHRAIIGLRDCGYADPAAKARPYLVMEYFDGLTLQQHVEHHGPLAVPAAVSLAVTLAEAMQAAHGEGVLHRDIKPANVMLKPARGGGGWDVRVIDFGLALRSSALTDSLSTARGNTVYGSSIAGTLDYAAPEQLGRLPGVKVGPPADIYGFAKTLSYALFKTPNPKDKHYQMLPPGLRGLLGRCLDDDPRERPRDFAEVLAGLTPCEDSAATPSKVRVLPPPPPPVAAAAPFELIEAAPEEVVCPSGHRIRPAKRLPPMDTSTRVGHALAAFFLGTFGFHKFVQGNSSAGVVRLLISITCIGLNVTAAVAIIEMIVYLTMSNEDYARKYLVQKKNWL